MNNTSFHAEVRLRQRGILQDTAHMLMKHGESFPAPDGAHKITLSAQKIRLVISELKKEIQWLERASHVVLIEKDGMLITGYKRRFLSRICG